MDSRVCCNGSSPRGRGKRRGWPVRATPARLIPARAGKTRCPPSSRVARWAHPRAGGENKSLHTIHSSVLGSSPRGRGKRELTFRCVVFYRLIPARAGKTLLARAVSAVLGAHPRAGGENLELDDLGWLRNGSSPRGRGKLRPIDLRNVPERLIPARAGKTPAPSPRLHACQAHPRAGGENMLSWILVGQRDGSSPRGRGKLGRDGGRRRVGRLIPARAGKTP